MAWNIFKRLEATLCLLNELDHGSFLAHHGAFLMALAQVESATYTELAELLNLSEASISRSKDSLVEKGLAEVKADPRSRRRYLVSLTEKGEELCERIASLFAAEERFYVNGELFKRPALPAPSDDSDDSDEQLEDAADKAHQALEEWRAFDRLEWLFRECDRLLDEAPICRSCVEGDITTVRMALGKRLRKAQKRHGKAIARADK